MIIELELIFLLGIFYVSLFYPKLGKWLIKCRLKMMGPQLYKSYSAPKKIPKSLRKLRYIKELVLDCGCISIIPDWFSELKTLEIVDFGFNKIEKIPKTLCKIRGLRELQFAYNNIRKIPPEICKLRNLVYLGLYCNNIGTLPIQMYKLRCLLILYDGNICDNIDNIVLIRFMRYLQNPNVKIFSEINVLQPISELL